MAVIPSNSWGRVIRRQWHNVANVRTEGFTCPPSSFDMRERSTSASYANSTWVLLAEWRNRFRFFPSAIVTALGSEPRLRTLLCAFFDFSALIGGESKIVLVKETSYTTQSRYC